MQRLKPITYSREEFLEDYHMLQSYAQPSIEMLSHTYNEEIDYFGEIELLSWKPKKGDVTVLNVFDKLFANIKFDKELLKRLVKNNIQFITRNPEVRDMMGSKLVGCFHLSYTQFHKNIFYEDVFGITYEEAVYAMKEITTIPKSFKIAMDDVNMVCFYMAHRFLSNKSLSNKDREDGAKEAFDYFGYRTLVLLCSKYWQYPIKREKAVSLNERLSGNYLITNMDNWNEYVKYRSSEFVRINLKFLTTLNNDGALPNTINDLYNRYKGMLLHIYREFIDLEDTDLIRSSNGVVTDLNGKEILLDRLRDPRVYVDKVKDSLVSREGFIRPDYIETADVIIKDEAGDQYEEILEMLGLIYTYYSGSKNAGVELTKFTDAFIIDSISYLKSKRLELNTASNVVDVISMIKGNLLYSRGVGMSITKIKDDGEKLLKKIYKKGKVKITDRNLTKMRNLFCIYILLIALI